MYIRIKNIQTRFITWLAAFLLSVQHLKADVQIIIQCVPNRAGAKQICEEGGEEGGSTCLQTL